MPTFIQSFYDKSANKFGSVQISCLKEGTMSLSDFNLLAKRICLQICSEQVRDFDIFFAKHKFLEEMICDFDRKYLEEIQVEKIII